jgi:hypothetical protein
VIFDQEHLEHQKALDDAFAAGELRGRETSDTHLMDECIDLRVELARRTSAAYREGVETGLFMACVVAAVIVAFGAAVWWAS